MIWHVRPASTVLDHLSKPKQKELHFLHIEIYQTSWFNRFTAFIKYGKFLTFISSKFFHTPSLFYFLGTIVTCILGHLSCKDHWCSINFFLFFFSPVFHCGYSVSSFAITNLMLISYDISFFNLRHSFYL